MKPHTRIIYYTLLCLALNHRRSRASIYGGAEEETSSVYACFLVFVCVLSCVHVCVCAWVFFHMAYGCKYVHLCIITQVDLVAQQDLINYLNAN